MRPRLFAFSILACMLACVLVTSLARAAPEPGSDPEKLFAEGVALMEKGSFAEALPKLVEAQRLDPGIGTQFNVAVCYEKTGKLGTAYRNYAEVLRIAKVSGKKQREDAAKTKLDALTPRVAALVIRGTLPADVTVRVDGAVVPKSDFDLVPVDPGSHAIEATATAKQAWSSTVETTTEGQRLEVVVPPLAAVSGQTKLVTITKETTNGRRTLGYILGGVGVAGAVVAGVTGVMLLNDKSTADDSCKPRCTTSDGRSAVTQAKTLLPINAVGWGVGAVGLGLGAYFLLTSGKKETASAKTAWSETMFLPSVSPGGASLSTVTRF